MGTNRVKPEHQPPVVAAIYVAAMFMAILDTTIVNVALPTIGRAFHAEADGVDLVSIAYLVSLAVFIPASGWLGDRLGGRTALLGAIAVFTLASALCGIAANLAELVIFRVLQGIGGAVMTPVGLSLLFRLYPPHERLRVSSILALFTTLAPALGPVLGGVFTSYLSWRLVFLVNAPVGVAALLLGVVKLDAHRQPEPSPLDTAGLLLSGVGLGATMFGVAEGPSLGWGSPAVLAAIGVGLVLLTALVRVELTATHPLIDLRLFGNRLFAACTGLYAFGSVAYLGALYLAALLFQDALGLSAIGAGLTTFPAAIGTMAGGQLVTRVLYRRLGPRRLATGGLLLVAAALGALATVTPAVSLWLVRLIMLALGLGIACVFIPSQAASMATISAAQTSRASSIFNAGKQLGGAVGVALLTTVVAAALPAHSAGQLADGLSAFHVGFLAAAAVAVLTVPVALAVPDRDAAPTLAAAPRSRPVAAPAPPRTRAERGAVSR